MHLKRYNIIFQVERGFVLGISKSCHSGARLLSRDPKCPHQRCIRSFNTRTQDNMLVEIN